MPLLTRPKQHDAISLERHTHSVGKTQRDGMKRRRNKPPHPKKATLYVAADIWQHVQAQKTTDLCAACTHPYSQVKMDKMSSLQQSRGDRGGPTPASQSAAPHRGGRCEYFERVMPFAISPTAFASQRATAKCQHSINSNNSNDRI